MSEYLSKEEIKKWRSSVEKITLEEYAARLGKKLQEEKKTNDLADMLYTHYNPTQMPADYDTVTKLEKIDLTPKTTHTKPKKQASKILPELDDLDINDDSLAFEETDMEDTIEEVVKEKPQKKEAKKTQTAKKEPATEEKPKRKEAAKEKKAEKPKETAKPAKAAKTTKEPKKTDKVEKTEKAAPKKEKAIAKKADKAEKNNFEKLNITFKKPLTEREEKVLAYFIEKKGEIVFAKDLAELLDLKRDYIYKYIKNLRAKMSTDIIANADNGGFLLN